jgi:hypothetical protein
MAGRNGVTQVESRRLRITTGDRPLRPVKAKAPEDVFAGIETARGRVWAEQLAHLTQGDLIQLSTRWDDSKIRIVMFDGMWKGRVLYIAVGTPPDMDEPIPLQAATAIDDLEFLYVPSDDMFDGDD